MRIKLGEGLSIDGKVAVIILIVLALFVYFRFFNDQEQGLSKETVQCIASGSKIYISTGCHACAAQEALLGDNFRYLDITDCLIDGDKCSQDNITSVPTWFINGEKRVGVQEIDTLLRLTGCTQ